VRRASGRVALVAVIAAHTTALEARGSGPGERAALDLLRRAYANHVAVEFTARSAEVQPPEIAALAARTAPEMEELRDPVTGQTIHSTRSIRVLRAADGRFVFFSRHHQFAGPPEWSTAVHIETPGFCYDRDTGVAQGRRGPACGDWDMPYAEMDALRARGFIFPLWNNARASILDRVAFLTAVLGGAPDTVATSHAGRITLSSALWACSATIDARTGELEESVITFPGGVNRYTTQVLEWGTEPIFPARHPRVEREVFTGKDTGWALIITFDSVRVLPEIDEEAFKWWTYSETAYDTESGKVLLKHDIPSDELTAKHQTTLAAARAAFRKSPPGAPPAPANRRTTIETLGWATAISCCVLLLGLWLRKRLQT
jgi:hypothetical protein